MDLYFLPRRSREMKIPSFNSSLTVKILAVSLPVIIAVSILFWCPSIRYMKRKALDSDIKTAQAQSELIKNALIYGMLRNNRDAIRETMDSLSRADNLLWLRIDDMNFMVHFSSNKKEIGQDLCSGGCKYAFTKRPWQIKTVSGRRVLGLFNQIPNMKSCYTASCHFHPKGQKTLGTIELGYSLEPMDRQIKTQSLMIALFGFFFISVLSILLYFIIRRFVLKPIAALTDGVRKTSYENLSAGMETGASDEIGVLARSFSIMKEELRQKREAAQKELDEYKASLLQAQKMEAIGALAAGIAHDFNNLLTAIMGYAEITSLQSDDTRVKENSAMVVNTAKKAAQLTRQILLIGRKVPPEQKPTDMARFMEDSMKILKRMVEENIEFEVSLSSGLPLVYIDPAQMTQVLLNLVINARDAMPGGGKINISIRDFHCDENYCRHYAYAKPGDFVMLSVSDTGPGIPEEIKQRIFEPFFTTKGPGKGTGLGLAVTHSIVAAHGGWINLYSEEDRGTRFNIYLPVFTEKQAPGKRPPAKEIETALHNREMSNETVLMVDDDPMVREVGVSMLAELGYRVITASNGMEAIDIYKAHGKKVGLIILDNIMPGMDGANALSALRGIDPSVKVVLSSGYAADERQIERSGFNGFLGKPYRLSQVAETVKKAMTGPETRN